MKKRVCENCQFFQEAGFAKNGWCTNPRRSVTTDMKLVVRRNELGCRNGWADDLFIVRSEASSDDIVLHDNIAAHPVPPASDGEVTFLVNTHRDKSSRIEPAPLSLPVDVVVGQTPSTKPVVERANLLGQDPRSAILKAREQYRTRMASEKRPTAEATSSDGQVAADAAESVTWGAAPEPIPAALASQRTPRRGEVPPVQLSEISREFPHMTSFPDDEARFSTVPRPMAGVELPRRSDAPVSQAAEPLTGDDQTDTILDHSMSSYGTTRFQSSARYVEPQEPVEEIEVYAGEPPQSDLVASVSELEADEWDASEDDYPADEIVPIYRAPRRRFEFSGWRRHGRSQAAPTETFEPEESYEPVEMPAATADVEDDQWDAYDEPLVLHDPVIAEFAPADEPDVDIAPNVPRMCQTCRDFRPADNGERGWCTNVWAFSHRRMVDSDEMACETSVGSWWLPHDDVWLVTADVSAHGQPTPLVDLWLARTEREEDESAGQRRRKRS